MPDIAFTVPAAPVILPLAVVAVILVTVRRRRGEPLCFAASLALVGYAAAAASLTLFPLHVGLGAYGSRAPWYESVNWIPITTIDERTFLLNIVLTVPLGMLLSLIGRSLGAVIWAGFLFSVLVEALQLAGNVLLNAGRLSDVNDVVANTAGAAIGGAVVLAVRALRPAAARAPGPAPHARR